MAQHDDHIAKRLKLEADRLAAIDKADIDSYIAEAINDPRGQKFLWWLLEVGKWGTNPFSTDTNTMAFNVGEMNVGAAILARIVQVNPMGFAQYQMQRQIEDDRRSERAARIAAGDDPDDNSDDSGD
jgi:hypothetical protein